MNEREKEQQQQKQEPPKEEENVLRLGRNDTLQLDSYSAIEKSLKSLTSGGHGKDIRDIQVLETFNKLLPFDIGERKDYIALGFKRKKKSKQVKKESWTVVYLPKDNRICLIPTRVFKTRWDTVRRTSSQSFTTTAFLNSTNLHEGFETRHGIFKTLIYDAADDQITLFKYDCYCVAYYTFTKTSTTATTTSICYNKYLLFYIVSQYLEKPQVYPIMKRF